MWKDADRPDQSQTLLIDIPDVAASNITEQEKKDLLGLPNITEKEMRQMNSFFQPYIFYHKIGKTTILFLRHISEPEKPYYTIEIDEKLRYIVQCHGFRNEWENKKADEVKAFEKEFAKFIKAPKKYKSERKDEECRKSA